MKSKIKYVSASKKVSSQILPSASWIASWDFDLDGLYDYHARMFWAIVSLDTNSYILTKLLYIDVEESRGCKNDYLMVRHLLLVYQLGDNPKDKIYFGNDSLRYHVIFVLICFYDEVKSLFLLLHTHWASYPSLTSPYFPDFNDKTMEPQRFTHLAQTLLENFKTKIKT